MSPTRVLLVVPYRGHSHPRPRPVPPCAAVAVSGLVLLFCKSHSTLRMPQCLKAAKRIASEVVWEHGLLLGGVGLCHGLSGTILCLLAVYNATNDQVPSRSHALSRSL